jgi:hypothetical protein
VTLAAPPDPTEAAEYYFRYICQVPAGDICEILERQLGEATAELGRVSEERSRHRYAPDKWSYRQVLGHINDVERLFTFRAFWFARGFDSPLPSFDEGHAMDFSGADERSWGSHLNEFRQVRGSTITLFRELPAEAWSRRGTASGNPFSVRALAYLSAGHLIHHLKILRERYTT